MAAPGNLGQLGRVGRASGLRARAWTPLVLGSALYDAWDAEATATIAFGGAAVNAWASVKGGLSAVQAVSAAKPVWSAVSVGGRPGITFDGLDDELTYAGVGTLPTGSTPGEIWAVVDQLVPATDTSGKLLLAYGGTATSNRRGLIRSVTAGVNRLQPSLGTGAATVSPSNFSKEFSGRHVLRAMFSGTTVTSEIDGLPGNSASGAPSTGTTRLRFGANSSDVAAGFCNYTLNYVAFTATLNSADAAKMLQFLTKRAGL